MVDWPSVVETEGDVVTWADVADVVTWPDVADVGAGGFVEDSGGSTMLELLFEGLVELEIESVDVESGLVVAGSLPQATAKHAVFTNHH